MNKVDGTFHALQGDGDSDLCVHRSGST